VLLPRIGRALAAVFAISVFGAGTLWFARSRDGAEPESHAEFAESEKFNSHAELAETAEHTSPGPPAGGAGARREPVGVARAESESHAETAETAEPDGEVGPLAEGAAERSEAGGVARAEFESHAEPAETAEPTSPGSPVGGAGERSEPEGVARADPESHAEPGGEASPLAEGAAERSEAGGVSRAEFESHAEAAEPGGTKPPHETSADVETHAKIAQNVAFELAYMLIQREQAMVYRDRLTLSGYGPAHPDRKTAEQKVVMLDGRIRELREMADYAEIVRSETKLSMERLRLASELKRKIGEMQKQGFGPNHPNVKSLHDSLELLLKRMEDARVSVIPLAPGVSLEMVHCPGIAPDFWMGKFEVTQEQWQRMMGNNPSRFKGAKKPVETVSWNDCQEFVMKLNELPEVKASGLTFRLPTEEEWETACRAGAPKSEDYCKLADGTQITESNLSRVAWFGKNWDEGPTEVGKNREPNAWGLYDMHGNVWEWTQTADGGLRVRRGGSFRSAGFCAAGFRGGGFPGLRFRGLGFRLAASGRTAAAPAKPEAAARPSDGKQAARSAAASRSEAVRPAMCAPGHEWKPGVVKTVNLGGGTWLFGGDVKLDMVHCPGVAPDFWMGKFEVTQEQWKQVMGTDPSHFKGAKNPVESVSWNDCQEFVRKLNDLSAAKETGLTFRLPTEEEWETACRAGAPKSERYCKLADGTQITESNLSRVAWFNKGWHVGPTEVGKNREPNAWGLYDMHGNVWEWTQTADGGLRVFRGGSFDGSAGGCAAGGRGRNSLDNRGGYLGFRLAASGRTAASPAKPEATARPSDGKQAALEPFSDDAALDPDTDGFTNLEVPWPDAERVRAAIRWFTEGESIAEKSKLYYLQATHGGLAAAVRIRAKSDLCRLLGFRPPSGVSETEWSKHEKTFDGMVAHIAGCPGCLFHTTGSLPPRGEALRILLDGKAEVGTLVPWPKGYGNFARGWWKECDRSLAEKYELGFDSADEFRHAFSRWNGGGKDGKTQFAEAYAHIEVCGGCASCAPFRSAMTEAGTDFEARREALFRATMLHDWGWKDVARPDGMDLGRVVDKFRKEGKQAK